LAQDLAAHFRFRRQAWPFVATAMQLGAWWLAFLSRRQVVAAGMSRLACRWATELDGSSSIGVAATWRLLASGRQSKAARILANTLKEGGAKLGPRDCFGGPLFGGGSLGAIG